MKKTSSKQSSKTKRKTKTREITRMSQLPATQGMLYEFRQEMKSDIARLEAKMESRFKGNDSKFKSIDARFNEVDARFNKVDARFDEMMALLLKMDAKLHSMDARIHQTLMIVEEQKIATKFVLDGHVILNDRVNRHDERFTEVDSFLSGFRK